MVRACKTAGRNTIFSENVECRHYMDFWLGENETK